MVAISLLSLSVSLSVHTTLLGAILTVQNTSRIAVFNQAFHSSTDTVSTGGTNSSGPKLAIINFDDGYKSQFTNAKPILDKYGFKASFFIVCNFVGKTAKQMNSSSVINFAGKGVEQMTWDNIITLYKQGHQIGAHTMNHLQNMTSMPKNKLDYEIGHSKQCLDAHKIYTTIGRY